MKSIILAFTSWRMLIVLLTGFSSGMPLALTASTLQAWMRTRGVDLTVIGVFSLVGIPYTLKFVWAPFMDRFVPPFFGRRRGWMLVTQVGLVATIGILGFLDPVNSTWLVATLAALVSFLSASQDIVIDAYRTEILKKEEFGAGAGVTTLGYRLAMITSGALALMMADHLPWQNVYAIMAALMGVGIFATLRAPEPDSDIKPPKSLREAFVDPLLDFIQRRGAAEVALFLVIYKLDAALTMALSTAFLIDLKFSLTEIGAVNKVFGMIAVIVGTLAGGAAMIRMSIRKALWIFGITQAFAGFSFMALAHLGKNYPMMITAVTVENFCSGLATAAYTAFMMSLCNRRFTATQYALITSLMALTRYVAAAPSGYMVKAMGYETYYLVCALAGIPGLLLLLRYRKWELPSDNAI